MKSFFNHYEKTLEHYRGMTIFATITAVVFVFFAASVMITNVQRQRAIAFDTLEEADIEAEQEMQAQILAERMEQELDAAFSGIDLDAHGVAVYDINADELLYEKNADTAMPLASITKVMASIIAYDYLNATDTIVIDETALATEGDSGLLLGEVWTADELVDFMLIISSNDAAVAIANAAGARIEPEEGSAATPFDRFVRAMNKKAHAIGLSKAEFSNPSGLDLNNETVPSALATPREVARLFSYALLEYPSIMNHSRLGSYSAVTLNGRSFPVENTNDLASSMPGLLASKTGYTLQAGGNLAIVVDVGFMRPVAIVVLGSTRAERFSDVELLYQATKAYFEEI